MQRRPLPDATVELFIGFKGMGKSSAMFAASAEAERRFFWDPMREHEDADFTVRSAAEALEVISALGVTPATVRWLPRGNLRQQFENFCIAAMGWGELMPNGESVSVLVEELARVTGWGKAGDLWGHVVSECRHWHLKVYATAQRTAEIDKTIVGGISRICLFWMPLKRDRLAAAADLEIPLEELDRLAPVNGVPTFEFIETDGGGRWSRSRLVHS